MKLKLSKIPHSIMFIVFSAFMVVASVSRSDALIIGMPGLDWINRYTTGLCSATYQTNNFMTWEQVQGAAQDGIQVADNEVICIVGHGAPGSIGGVAANVIAATITDRVAHHAGDNNPIYILACFGAVTPNAGQSVMQAFQAVAGEAWANNPIAGARGICVADRNGALPLYRSVMQQPLPDNGACSQITLRNVQNGLRANVQANINNCTNNNVGDLAIGQCLFSMNNPDGLAVNNNFYNPFLQYIADNNCGQDPPYAIGVM